jgi:hypothetical protein
MNYILIILILSHNLILLSVQKLLCVEYIGYIGFPVKVGVEESIVNAPQDLNS